MSLVMNVAKIMFDQEERLQELKERHCDLEREFERFERGPEEVE